MRAWTDLERYVLEEHVDEFNKGIIDRRELLRRITLITGSIAGTLAALPSLGCKNENGGGAASPAVEAAPAADAPAAESSASPTGDATIAGPGVRDDDPRILAARTEVKAADGSMLIAYLARPKGDGKLAAVLVCHENKGLLPYIQDVCRRLAVSGFVALSVDLLSRQGGADKLTDPAAYAAALGKADPDAMLADLRTALDFLKGHANVAADRRGAMGFCFGGGMTWNLVASAADIKAAVPFYGPPPKKVEALATTKVKVFAVYAEKDTRITSSRPQIEEQLKKSGAEYKIVVYPGVDHAFHNDTGPRYDAPQAMKAWGATIEWFRKWLA